MSDVILRVECVEPEGTFIREVRPLIFTAENLRKLWERSSQFRTLFGEEVVGDFNKFCNLLVSQGGQYGLVSNGLFWVIDDFVGIFYITHIRPEIDAHVHYSFFDRRHRGREALVEAMVRYVFNTYKFRRLTAEVPMFVVRHSFAFLERIGFKKEGRKRKAARYKDGWFDINCFGLLSEDIV